MKKFRQTILAAILVMMIATATGMAEPEVRIHPITDNIYRLECVNNNFGCVNVTVFKGEQGLLVVDAGYYGTREKLHEALMDLGNGKVSTIIHTHSHGDHVSGNKLIGGDARIIAHEKTIERLGNQYGFISDNSPVLMPTVSVDDSLILDFENEKIRLIHMPGAHTDGDIIVHFVNSKVVCTGDIVFADLLPFIHTSRGGRIYNFLEGLSQLPKMFGDDITFVPGHGRTYTRAEVLNYYDQCSGMVEAVETGVEKGKNYDELLAADVLKEWKAWSDPVYTTDSLLIQLIYQNKIYAGNPPKPIGDVLLPVILEKGVGDAVKLYHELKNNEADKYEFAENELNTLGYNLMFREMLDEAEAIFGLNIEEYPNSANVYDSMGEIYMVKGEKELAIKHYEKSLELNPDNKNAVDMLEQLQ